MADHSAAAKTLHDKAWALVQSLQRRCEDRRDYYGRIGDIYQILISVPRFRSKISIHDLDAFYHDILFNTKRKSIENVTREDLTLALQKYLLHEERSYDFYFGPLMVAGFPASVELGLGQLRPLSELPEDVRGYIGTHHTHSHFRPRRAASKESEASLHDWFFHLNVKTIGWIDAIEKAELGKRRSLTAYELVTGAAEFTLGYVDWIYPAKPDVQFYMFCNGSHESQHYQVADVPRFVGRVPGSEEAADDMTVIVRKSNCSELERRLITSADVFGMLDENTPLNVKFLLKMIALEGLLLSEDDRDYLGWKLAEKIAFLLGDNKYWMAFAFGFLPHLGFMGNFAESLVKNEFVIEKRSESRVLLNREVTRLYRKRSGFAHQQKNGVNQVTEYDYQMISWLLRLSVVAMLALTRKGITHQRKQKSTDPHSFDGLIEKLKY